MAMYTTASSKTARRRTRTSGARTPSVEIPRACPIGKRVAVGLLLVFARPAVRGWSRAQWLAVGLFALSLAGMNGFYYAAIALIPWPRR